MTRQGRWCCVHTPAPLVVQRIAINGDWQYWLEGRKKITISTGRRTPTGFHATDQGQSNLCTCQETRIKYFTRKKKNARLIYKSPETIHWFMIPCREKPNNGAMRVLPRPKHNTHSLKTNGGGIFSEVGDRHIPRKEEDVKQTQQQHAWYRELWRIISQLQVFPAALLWQLAPYKWSKPKGKKRLKIYQIQS